MTSLAHIRQQPVAISCHLRAFQVSERKVAGLMGELLGYLGLADHSVAVSFVGSRRIQTLNQQFRAKDRSTDVLSFPQLDWPRPLPVKRGRNHSARSVEKPRDVGPPLELGDIVISLPNAEANAKGIGQSLSREVVFLLIHGLLHLVGHDHIHAADERRMRTAQRALLNHLEAAAMEPQLATIVRRRRPAMAATKRSRRFH